MSIALVWALGTGVVGLIFARALHRWADRITHHRRVTRARHRLGLLASLDETPTPYLREVTPRTPAPRG